MYLKKLTKLSKTVFSVEDLQKIFEIDDKGYLRVLISRMKKRGELESIYQGIYVYSQDYDRFELANKLKIPSYVSLETVLVNESVVFQDYGKTIFSISNNRVIKNVGVTKYDYSKIKDEILLNPLGIEFDGQVIRASVERAVCDRMYLTQDYYFDNLDGLNKDKWLQIAGIYNKRVYREVKNLC